MLLTVSISVPDHVRTEDSPKSLVVKFKTIEEKRAYVVAESKATTTALKSLARAWTKQERQKAYLDVYNARKNFHADWSHSDNSKQIA